MYELTITMGGCFSLNSSNHVHCPHSSFPFDFIRPTELPCTIDAVPPGWNLSLHLIGMLDMLTLTEQDTAFADVHSMSYAPECWCVFVSVRRVISAFIL